MYRSGFNLSFCCENPSLNSTTKTEFEEKVFDGTLEGDVYITGDVIGQDITCTNLTSSGFVKSSTAEIPTINTNSVTFIGNQNTGLYNDSNAAALSVDNTQVFRFGANQSECRNPLWLAVGDATNPSLAFSANSDTGIYHNTSTIHFTVDGSLSTSIKSTGVESKAFTSLSGGFKGVKSTVNPLYSFTGDTDTGLDSSGNEIVSLYCGGIESLKSTPTTVQSKVQHQFTQGTLEAPGIAFINDGDTGFSNDTKQNIFVYCGGGTPAKFTTAFTEVSQLRVQNDMVFSTNSLTGITNDSNAVAIKQGGNIRCSFRNEEIEAKVPFRGQNGSSTIPTYSFDGKTNTGIYLDGDSLSFSINGVTTNFIDGVGFHGDINTGRINSVVGQLSGNPINITDLLINIILTWGDVVVNLPPISPANAGNIIIVKIPAYVVGTKSLTASGYDMIDDLGIVLMSQGDRIQLVADEVNARWHIISH